MKPHYNHKLKSLARTLRKNSTKQENHLWYDFLRSYPYKFRRQRPIDRFIVDFYCEEANLVVELDGSQHYSEKGTIYDEDRTKILNSLGLTVLRFSNHDIDTEFSAVCQHIHNTVSQTLKRRTY